MTWTALVVLPSWCLSDCLSPLCQYCISMSVTVYIFPCRPPCPAIWRRELVLSVSLFSVYLTALCIPSLCLYPCSPSMLLLCIYQLCLPLPVVLTSLLSVALCMPRTALVVFMAFCVCFTHLCPRLYLSVLLLYVCLTACLVCIYSFRACGFPVGTLPTTVCVVPGLNQCPCSQTLAVHLCQWLVYSGNMPLACSCGCRLYLVLPFCALTCGEVSVRM